MLYPSEKATVTCPFYRGDNKNIVTCEGIDPDNIVVIFGRSIDTYCQSDWRKCQIARMIWARYDDLSSLKYMDPEHQNLYDPTVLNEEQRRFCEEYLIDQNATRAYMAAFPSAQKKTCAASGASYLLKRPHIQEYLERRGFKKHHAEPKRTAPIKPKRTMSAKPKPPMSVKPKRAALAEPHVPEELSQEAKDYGLNEKQLRFCKEYLLSRNATRAYTIAYPTVKNSNSAGACASYLLKKPQIKAYLEKHGLR